MKSTEKAQQSLEKALGRLPEQQELANLTIEQLSFIIAEVVSHELDSRDAVIKKRKKKSRNTCWKRVQKVGWVIGPLAGLAVIGKACGLY